MTRMNHQFSGSNSYKSRVNWKCGLCPSKWATKCTKENCEDCFIYHGKPTGFVQKDGE